MIFPNFILETAQDFWESARVPRSVPADLETACQRALPLSLISMSELSIQKVFEWSRKLGLDVRTPTVNRPLHAMLWAFKGHGFLFVNASDSFEDRLFSMAHESAHFILDYQMVRQRATKTVGPEVCNALDGERIASLDERIHGALQGISVQPHTHLLARTSDGLIQSASVLLSESMADHLAFELLAPSEAAFKVFSSALERTTRDAAEAMLCAQLQENFGFPPRAAKTYAAIIRDRTFPGRSISEWLSL